MKRRRWTAIVLTLLAAAATLQIGLGSSPAELPPDFWARRVPDWPYADFDDPRDAPGGASLRDAMRRGMRHSGSVDMWSSESLIQRWVRRVGVGAMGPSRHERYYADRDEIRDGAAWTRFTRT